MSGCEEPMTTPLDLSSDGEVETLTDDGRGELVEMLRKEADAASFTDQLRTKPKDGSLLYFCKVLLT